MYGENGYLTEVLDYDGPVVYLDGVPDYILTGEGRLVFREEKEPVYEYFLADHLGNTRVTFRVEGDSVSVVQENHYYPFGLSMAGLDYSGLPEEDATQNPYLYNGKEFQGDEGLGWYDYGARFYDAQVGRWWSVDPMAEQFKNIGEYVYTSNCPIRYYDVMGMFQADELWNYMGDNSEVEYLGSSQYLRDQEVLEKQKVEEKKKETVQNADSNQNLQQGEQKDNNYANSQGKNGDAQTLILLGIGLSADKAESAATIFQESNAAIRVATVRNNLPTTQIDKIIGNTSKFASGIKWVGRGVIVVGVGISIYQGYDAYNQGDIDGIKNAGLDLAVGLGAAALGGVPGILLYGGYMLMMLPPSGCTVYHHPDIFLNDNTFVAPPVTLGF